MGMVGGHGDGGHGDGGHGDGGHHPGGEQGEVTAAPGDSPSGSLPSKLLPSQGGHVGPPALGITAAFAEPHEELIRWRSRDGHRH